MHRRRDRAVRSTPRPRRQVRDEGADRPARARGLAERPRQLRARPRDHLAHEGRPAGGLGGDVASGRGGDGHDLLTLGKPEGGVDGQIRPRQQGLLRPLLAPPRRDARRRPRDRTGVLDQRGGDGRAAGQRAVAVHADRPPQALLLGGVQGDQAARAGLEVVHARQLPAAFGPVAPLHARLPWDHARYPHLPSVEPPVRARGLLHERMRAEAHDRRV
mmetsp:Transcript_17182/g.53411  ORF Transcript_17182/g.53411 Transcript_17182/m.53411 type:complete len:217 (-) Transcript_17182:429-1079(-)